MNERDGDRRMSTPKPHIHKACIVLWAADPMLRVEACSDKDPGWSPLSEDWSIRWFEDWRFRVLDHDGTVLAETPPPKRMVRVPQWDGPAPADYFDRIRACIFLSNENERYEACPSNEVGLISVKNAFACRHAFESLDDAQQWVDFLNTKWEEVGE